MTYFKENNFPLSEGPFFTFFDRRTEKDRNATKLRKMPFLKQSYISFPNPKLHEACQ
jgi:hypothetical protein